MANEVLEAEEQGIGADLGVEGEAVADGPLTHEVGVDETLHAAEHDAPGMPQLDTAVFPNLIFWLVIALLAIYFLLSRIALPRIGAILAERAGTVTNDLAAAEDLKAKAKDAEAAYEKALADARAEANRIADETRARVQADLDAEMEKADARIAERTAESERAIAEIRDQAADAVREVARDAAREIVAVMGVEADPSAVDAAVNDRV
ncbi:F0F1 ATP synthase subunit B' [Wenxinia marina]|uniref:ATP synthase subunit b n=1 Tax=Wenxinia marina DSM 24838 TaxID=1123501 RepID=A0A0D0Q054_9RHOB|nr:F0F1 ATP synthase subunit B' [Wenxinia marina]KIQ67989.1 F0F1-type ATP synthase, subunit b [Wenxinia marina DSM 24838]GGL75607.1 ATP synthase subunit b 2 [Wenxinia marina]